MMARDTPPLRPLPKRPRPLLQQRQTLHNHRAGHFRLSRESLTQRRESAEKQGQKNHLASSFAPLRPCVSISAVSSHKAHRTQIPIGEAKLPKPVPPLPNTVQLVPLMSSIRTIRWLLLHCV